MGYKVINQSLRSTGQGWGRWLRCLQLQRTARTPASSGAPQQQHTSCSRCCCAGPSAGVHRRKCRGQRSPQLTSNPLWAAALPAPAAASLRLHLHLSTVVAIAAIVAPMSTATVTATVTTTVT
jgi:hypothetical protein